ncbi:dihydrolipoyl dehydrogenase [Aliiglaciecola sp. LCG003]|uniref:dihydrolipoyl dehydrogenase n=1 Tax=Aliiglaciecola sp. LCG003 TaxID=3053655 RepID=UPI0025748140|nr:dihydrolipoyl dehydrogenase [Aliiglaciecola sp. LCG003]WJG10386.1 dihydrolipoyl dehydrogenase [Aliiglaciecola sp. LCG003]
MKTLVTDVAIIGAGTAGMGAYRAAKKHTDKVLLIESGSYGTTCARVGCMPSKLLIAAAERAHDMSTASPFGVSPLGGVQIDGKAVMQRVRDERDRFSGFVVETVEQFPEQDKIKGQAKFIDNHTLQVDQHTRISAKRIVIATGSRPVYPGFFEAAGERLIVNDDVFNWQDLPKSVAVFGPGVIGLELGQALHRLGVKTKVFGIGGSIGPLTDPAIKQKATEIFAAEYYLDTQTKDVSIANNDEGVALTYRNTSGELVEESFDYLLAATGRRPNVDNLDIQNTDLQLDQFGVPLADPFTMQAGQSNIFIAGDASNMLPLLHEATDQGKIAGDNAGRGDFAKAGLRRTPISVVFSDPQIAMIGMTHSNVMERYGSCDCFASGEVSFENQGRSRVILKNKGMLRVYAEQGTGLFLGAEMIGPAAEHIAHLLAWAVQAKMTVQQMLDMPFYHPVIEEGLRTALRDVYANLRFGPAIVEHCIECGPGA